MRLPDEAPAVSDASADGAAILDPRHVLTSLGAAVYDWDLVSDRIAWSANAAEVLGLPDLAAWSTGRAFGEIVDESPGLSRAEAIDVARDADDGSGVAYRTSYTIRTAPGRTLLVEDGGRWFADRTGRPATAHGMIRVSSGDAAAVPPGFRARETLLRIAATEIAEGRQNRRALSILTIAIRNLAELNEELGFEAVDDLMDAAAARIEKTRRQRDRFVRYAGNRFAILLRGCTAEQTPVAAARLAQLIAAEPITTSAGPVRFDLVIGAASCPDHASDAAGLFRRAEQALGLAKKRAGCAFLLFDPAALRAAPRGRAAAAALDCAEILNGRRIVLARQPVVEAASRRVAFSEALLRVRDPDGRITPAADVIPSFERAGLIHFADARMLELAADHLAAHPEESLSLNVSPLTLEAGEWLGLLGSHLGARPGIASRLIVEVTETAAIRDPAAIRRILEGIKSLGCTIAIDDFGAGHTSFRQLRDFPVDYLKIDGVFVQNLVRQPSDGFFVRTLLDLARHLGIATVAEWVEDEQTAQILTGWGADFLQGDMLGLPRIVAPPEAAPAEAGPSIRAA